MNAQCSSCGSVFWKNEGEWTGPMLIDFIFALAASLYTWAALVYFDCSLTSQLVVTGLIAALGGVLVYAVVTQPLDDVPLRDGRDGRSHRQNRLTHRKIVRAQRSRFRLIARSARSVFDPSTRPFIQTGRPLGLTSFSQGAARIFQNGKSETS